MKKLFVVILMLVYGFSSMGMTVHLHYCCGKLKSIEWLPVKESSDKCKMSNKGCCDTKEIANKRRTDQLFSQIVFKSFKAHTVAVPQKALHETLPASGKLQPVSFISPPQYSPPLFILHRVFRI